MSLSFPRHEADDIRLELSPLSEVVCQVRFPPILRIGRDEPVDFQEAVRHRFPLLETEFGVAFQVDISSGVPHQLSQSLDAPRLHRFISADRTKTVTLASDFFALSTTHYDVWESFTSDLKMIHDAVDSIYQPSFATRIGLRYINLLRPGRLGLPGIREVMRLIRAELTSAFYAPVWSEPTEMSCQLVLENEGGALSLRFGQRNDLDEPLVALDLDYYEEGQLPIDDLVSRCDRFHAIIYDAFRWSINPEAMDVFKPVPKGGIVS